MAYSAICAVCSKFVRTAVMLFALAAQLRSPTCIILSFYFPPSLPPSLLLSLPLLGYRLMKIVLFMIGFVIGGALTYFIILTFLHHRGETWVPWVAGSVGVVVGILCGVLTICIYYIGIFLAGGSIGFLIAWFILAAINIPFFRTHIYVPILVSVTLAIVVGIIALIIQKWFFMFGTALLGGFKIAWGVDYYLELGSMIYYLLLFAEHRAELNPCWYSWCMIGLFVILVVIGFIIQATLTGRKYDHKKDLKGESTTIIFCDKNATVVVLLSAM